jgi:hypothetical protein
MTKRSAGRTAHGGAYKPGHAYDFGLPRVLHGLAALFEGQPAGSTSNSTRHTKRTATSPSQDSLGQRR